MGTRTQATQIVTYDPASMSPRWLGMLGAVSQTRYSYVCPGGPDQLSCVLALEAFQRTDALNPGRIVKAWRGGSCVWDGQLDEPNPGSDGWEITATGAGNFGASFAAVSQPSGMFRNEAIDAAIARGLRWVNPGISSAIGFIPATPPDQGSVMISDWLGTITQQAGLLWYIGRNNYLNVFGYPSPYTPTRYIITRTPPARSVAGFINTLWYKYLSATSKNGNQTYTYSSVQNSDSIRLHQPMEGYIDMTNAGQLTATQAQNNANNVLGRYNGVSFAGPITVGPGDYTTIGGTPVDLGCEQAGEVAKVLVTDTGYGGQVRPGPLGFIVGQYEYNDDGQTADITPIQSYRTDLGTLIAVTIPKLRQ